MGQIFALCGPSGVGKTTFQDPLRESQPESLRFLPRATSRPRRQGEKEGTEYHFYSKEGFLQKIFANDFVHVEEYGEDLFGIEALPIEDAIHSEYDSIIMAGVYGATRLRDVFGSNVTVLYMYTGSRQSLLRPECLTDDDPQITELKRRLLTKIEDQGIELFGISPLDFVRQRMNLNSIELAYVNGRIRSGETIIVLENFRDRMSETLAAFNRIRETSSRVLARYYRSNLCFVLMPFREELLPIYEDHLVPTLRRIGFECLRADRIFSNRPIIEDVLEVVRRSRIIISDLTMGNPNVFYETGFCHALGKDVILITQDEKVPFDLRHIRHIKYTYTPRGMAAFEDILIKTINSVLST